MTAGRQSEPTTAPPAGGQVLLPAPIIKAPPGVLLLLLVWRSTLFAPANRSRLALARRYYHAPKNRHSFECLFLVSQGRKCLLKPLGISAKADSETVQFKVALRP